ncbi:hypothetical protein V8E36_001099 [Tilletia maclaganii]
MLDWNVRMGRLAHGRVEETWARWETGEPAASFGMMGEARHLSSGRRCNVMLLASVVRRAGLQCEYCKGDCWVPTNDRRWALYSVSTVLGQARGEYQSRHMRPGHPRSAARRRL